ncbi:MAG: GNAT family N-acetyltransferase [Candidatus Dormibacteraeota bacterium]|nr:GNAT family N-acetyltransferase [Candidatus Dormibacteraeota bacterium]
MALGRVAGLEIRAVTAEAVRPLRHRVLRADMALESERTESDDRPATVHLAAFDGDEIVGVMTVFADPSPLGDSTAQRIRWMAVDPARQRGAIGTALLEAGLAIARKRRAVSVWADARDTALGFYERHGFRPSGPSFIDPETGLAHTPVVLDLIGDRA